VLFSAPVDVVGVEAPWCGRAWPSLCGPGEAVISHPPSPFSVPSGSRANPRGVGVRGRELGRFLV